MPESIVKLAMDISNIAIKSLSGGASSIKILSLVACVNHRHKTGELKLKPVLGYASFKL